MGVTGISSSMTMVKVPNQQLGSLSLVNIEALPGRSHYLSIDECPSSSDNHGVHGV